MLSHSCRFADDNGRSAIAEYRMHDVCRYQSGLLTRLVPIVLLTAQWYWYQILIQPTFTFSMCPVSRSALGRPLNDGFKTSQTNIISLITPAEDVTGSTQELRYRTN